ncbi:MAG: hypothetical protein CMP40_01595 [Rickettsiales bacterium]|nr:hypothetical protein [Rickettsiales bacterium]
MKKLQKTEFFSNNLVKKRNFFVNILILSSLALVFSKNIHKVRYTEVISEEGNKYILDKFTYSIKLIK